MSEKIVLTGDRPTGSLHIGHYFGSLLNRKKYEQEYETYIMMADIQALTDNWEKPEKVSKNVMEVAIDNLALGLDTARTTLFIQSQIPQIAELTVLFSNLVSLNRLKRNPTVKTEIEQKKALFGQDAESLTFGFLGYPISQTADIAVVRANLVPVGADQLPVIEQGQEIIEKFNKIYKNEVFPKFEAMISNGSRIKGLDGNAKMSKSLNNAIYMSDTEEQTLEKIKVAKTDSENFISYDPKNRPAVSNLVLIFSLIHDITPKEAVDMLGSIQYGAFKAKLGTDLNTHLKDFRERRKELASQPDKVKQILREGIEKTLKTATKTMDLVRENLYISY
jgi:tryptophanyl-tRNA synthetase